MWKRSVFRNAAGSDCPGWDYIVDGHCVGSVFVLGPFALLRRGESELNHSALYFRSESVISDALRSKGRVVRVAPFLAEAHDGTVRRFGSLAAAKSFVERMFSDAACRIA